MVCSKQLLFLMSGCMALLQIWPVYIWFIHSVDIWLSFSKTVSNLVTCQMFRQISVFTMFHLEEWSLRIITLHLNIYILKIAESLREPRKNEIGKKWIYVCPMMGCWFIPRKLKRFSFVRNLLGPKVIMNDFTKTEFYYRPIRSCGKVMFLHLSVILFTGGRGVWQTPQKQPSPPVAEPPLQNRHPNPPPRDSHCSGQYASYWNAFLLKGNV